MNEETLELFLDRLEPLAQKLGQGAEFLWEVSLRQVIVRGSVSAVLAVLLLIAGYMGNRVFRRKLLAEDRLYREEEWTFLMIAFPVIGVGVGLSILLFHSLPRLLNPGYFGIEYLMRGLGL